MLVPAVAEVVAVDPRFRFPYIVWVVSEKDTVPANPVKFRFL